MGVIIAQTDLESRMSINVVRAILDDNNDGVADTNPVDQLIADAESKVLSYYQPTYGATLPSPVPAELKRMTLDVAQAMAGQRHPEIVRQDWEKRMIAAERDLTRMRKRETTLGIDTAPEPSALDGASIVSQVEDEDEPVKVFVGGMGEF